MPMFSVFNYWVQLADNFTWFSKTMSAMWAVMLPGWLVGGGGDIRIIYLIRHVIENKEVSRRRLPSSQICFSANIHWFPNKPNVDHQEGGTLVSIKGKQRVAVHKTSNETCLYLSLQNRAQPPETCGTPVWLLWWLFFFQSHSRVLWPNGYCISSSSSLWPYDWEIT